jgi:hypothetical protein
VILLHIPDCFPVHQVVTESANLEEPEVFIRRQCVEEVTEERLARLEPGFCPGIIDQDVYFKRIENLRDTRPDRFFYRSRLWIAPSLHPYASGTHP